MLITVTIHNDLFLSIIVLTLCRDHASFFILTSLVDIPCQVEAAGAHQVIPIVDAQLNHVSNPLPALVIVALLNLLVKRLLDVREACFFFNRLEVRRELLAIASKFDAYFSFGVEHGHLGLLDNQSHLNGLLPYWNIIFILLVLLLFLLLLIVVIIALLLLLLLLHHLLLALGFFDRLHILGGLCSLVGYAFLQLIELVEPIIHFLNYSANQSLIF